MSVDGLGEKQEYKTGKGGQAASKGCYSARSHGGSLELNPAGKFWNPGEKTCFKGILQEEGPGRVEILHEIPAVIGWGVLGKDSI